MSHLAFLKAISDKRAHLLCIGNTNSTSVVDLAQFVESSEFICTKHHAIIRDLIKMQVLKFLQLDSSS